ncbi:hypothetical protein [Marinobacter salarius]|uniref:hypothetical protein n=1 Tax=Marinobacter salarius TaxID=1420917 RepID=UPI003BAA2C04
MCSLKELVLVLLVCASFSTAIAESNPLPIPDSKDYRAFLLKEWNPSQPSVVMMLDPFCPYCIRTLEQKERLKNYNVFLFWSPILGVSSEKRVAEILACKRPVGPSVIFAVTGRKSPKCSPRGEQDHPRLNQAMVDAYSPQAVPAYYFGGRRVSLNQLNRYVSTIGTIAGTASVDWERYEIFRVAQPSNRVGHVGVILPENFQRWDSLLRIIRNATQFEWHILSAFNGAPAQQFCEATSACDKASAQELDNKREELMMLFGLSSDTELRFILNDKLLNRDEVARVLGTGSI